MEDCKLISLQMASSLFFFSISAASSGLAALTPAVNAVGLTACFPGSCCWLSITCFATRMEAVVALLSLPVVTTAESDFLGRVILDTDKLLLIGYTRCGFCGTCGSLTKLLEVAGVEMTVGGSWAAEDGTAFFDSLTRSVMTLASSGLPAWLPTPEGK